MRNRRSERQERRKERPSCPLNYLHSNEKWWRCEVTWHYKVSLSLCLSRVIYNNIHSVAVCLRSSLGWSTAFLAGCWGLHRSRRRRISEGIYKWVMLGILFLHLCEWMNGFVAISWWWWGGIPVDHHPHRPATTTAKSGDGERSLWFNGLNVVLTLVSPEVAVQFTNSENPNQLAQEDSRVRRMESGWNLFDWTWVGVDT